MQLTFCYIYRYIFPPLCGFIISFLTGKKNETSLSLYFFKYIQFHFSVINLLEDIFYTVCVTTTFALSKLKQPFKCPRNLRIYKVQVTSLFWSNGWMERGAVRPQGSTGAAYWKIHWSVTQLTRFQSEMETQMSL